MPWHKVTSDHYQNHSNKHLYWDKISNVISLEGWAEEPGFFMTSIPVDVLDLFLQDNDYYLVSKSEYVKFQNMIDLYTETNSKMYHQLEHEQIVNEEKSKREKSLASLVASAEKAFEQALKVVEFDKHKIMTEISNREKAEKEVERLKIAQQQIIAAAQKEIESLRAQIITLKEQNDCKTTESRTR